MMYDGVCQKFTSSRLTGCVKMLLSQISDGFIAKSSKRSTIHPDSQNYLDKENKNTLLRPKCTVRNMNADQEKDTVAQCFCIAANLSVTGAHLLL